MDNKLERFFNKINYTNLDEFKDSKIDKVVINKIKESWTVYIENMKPINIETMLDLISVSKKGIDGVSTINIRFINNNITDDNIIEYFKYLLNEVSKKSPSLSSIINNNIFLNSNIITIEVSSKLEEKMVLK